VRRLRAFNALAMARVALIPLACSWRITGNTFAAKVSAALRFASAAIAWSTTVWVGLRRSPHKLINLPRQMLLGS